MREVSVTPTTANMIVNGDRVVFHFPHVGTYVVDVESVQRGESYVNLSGKIVIIEPDGTIDGSLNWVSLNSNTQVTLTSAFYFTRYAF